MKICLLSPKYPPDVGGLAISVQRLAQGLAAAGHIVHVVAPDGSLLPGAVSQIAADGIIISRFGLYKRADDRRLVWFELVVRLHQQVQFDVLHGYYVAGVGLVTVYAARYLGVPSLVSARGNDLERNEIRPGEVDGNPATTEVIVGGKDGGVWAFGQDGRELWADFIGPEIGEIASVNLPELGGPMILFGDENGGVTAFSTAGARLFNFNVSGEVLRLEEGKLGETNGIIVSDGREMIFYTFASQSAPFWYTPIVAGVLACLIIAGVAYFLMNNLQPAPTLQVSAQKMSVEAQIVII